MKEWLTMTRRRAAVKGAAAMIAVLAPLALLSSEMAQAASFDCAMATAAVEKMICADAELSKLDEALGEAYVQMMARSVDPEALKSEQRAWLRDVRGACADNACLTAVYWTRIGELEEARFAVGGDFAVDQDAYRQRAKSVLARLLKGREFLPDANARMSSDAQRHAMELMGRFQDGNFEVVPPFEWSADNPDLPGYVKARQRCPNFDFEFIPIDIRPTATDPPDYMARATERFGLYRIPDSPIFAYRAERYIRQRDEWGRRRVRLDPKVEESTVTPFGGFYNFFDSATCKNYDTALIHRGRSWPSNVYFSEIVIIDEDLYFATVYMVFDNFDSINKFFDLSRWYKILFYKMVPDVESRGVIRDRYTLKASVY